MGTVVISKIFDFIKSLNVPSLVVALIASAIITYYLNRLLSRGEKKKKEQQDRLKVHFQEELVNEKDEIINQLSNLRAECGIIYYKGSSVKEARDTVITLPKPSVAFDAHFPKETAELKRLAGLMADHHKSRNMLINEIRKYTESLGFTVGHDNPMNISPFIYDIVFDILFLHWGSSRDREYTSWFDFRSIETKSGHGLNLLFVSGWGSSAIAYAEAEVDKEGCRRVILEISQDVEYKKKAVGIVDAVDSLVAQLASFCAQLGGKVADVAKYWPGTKVYKFKIEKKTCPRCKQIFD